jgi:anti-sigma28 factor (negative regulator of flagellin synthesis)
MNDNMRIGAKSEALESGLLARILKRRQEKKEAESKVSASSTGTDKVDVSIGRAIQDELNPQEILAARRQRVEELKELIAKGEYNPSSEDVAAAVLENLTFEITRAGSDE